MMFTFSQFTNYFVLCCLFFLICTNSYSNSQDDIDPDATPIETPTEAPEPAEDNYDICDIPYLGGDVPKPVPENLMRMGRNSKYFILVGENNMPIKEVSQFCESIGLQPAEVRHRYDLAWLKIFLEGLAPANTTFSLGMNDEKEEGSFVEYDGTPIQFHSFSERQPDNKMNTESCVEVSVYQELRHDPLVYNDVDCNRRTTPVCMFKPTDKCFLASPITYANVQEDFDFVGSSAVRDYYVKPKQYPWSEAAAQCAKAGFKLVDFNTGFSNNQELYGLLRVWLHRNIIFHAIPFWTGAKLVRTDTVKRGQRDSEPPPQYKFESSGKVLNDLSEWPTLVWDAEEPSDSSGLGLEECISAVLYTPYQSFGNRVITLATTNCKIPHYPICYKEKSFDTVNETVPEDAGEGLSGRSGFGRDPNAGKFCSLEEIKVDLSMPHLSVNELLKLAAVSRHKGIHSNNYRFPWAANQSWLQKLIEEIYRVPKEVCPASYVPPEFFNIMHNLLILYYNAVADKIKDPDDAALNYLDSTAGMLYQCSTQVQPIHFDSRGGLPTTFGKFSVTPVEELMDSEIEGEHLYADVVIDTFWHLYLITVAACYPYETGSKTFWLQEVHNLFTNHFLGVFQERWFSSKTVVDIGVVMGDMDVDAVYYSLRACAIGAFQRSNITELYFPRPVFIKRKAADEINLKIQELPDLPEPESDLVLRK